MTLRRLRLVLAHEAPHALVAEELALLVAPLEDAVREQQQHLARVQPREAAAEARLGQRPDHGAAVGELHLGDLAGRLLAEEQDRRLVAGVDVDQVPVALELGVEDAHEAARQPRAVDHPVELLEHVGDLELLLDPHPQPGHHVAHEQRRGQAVAARVADREPERALAEVVEVVEVAAHLVRRAPSARRARSPRTPAAPRPAGSAGSRPPRGTSRARAGPRAARRARRGSC